MTAFYPSCVCNFKIHFDNSLTVIEAPVSVSDLLKNPVRGPSSPATSPLLLQRGAQDESSFIFGRVPKSASIELPGYRQAGQFSCEFAWKDLPIDPRTVRSAAVEIHLGVVSAKDASDGFGGASRGGVRTSLLQTVMPNGRPNAETFVMSGLIDEWDTVHNGSGSSISFKGRDLRGFLIDTPIGAGAPGVGGTILNALDLSQPLDSVISSLLAFHPAFRQFTVVMNPNDWPNQEISSPAIADILPRHRRGAKTSQAKKGGRVTPATEGDKITFWDLIVKLCYLCGAIPYFRGNELCIRPSRSIFDQLRGDVNGVAIGTPFAGGKPRTFDRPTKSPISPGLSIRRFVYGRDIETWSFSRKFSGANRPQIVRCVSVDTSAEAGDSAHIEATWPEQSASKAAQTTQVPPGQGPSQKEYVNIPVPGVSDPTRLKEIARSIYEEIGRGEQGGSVETRNLASFGGDNTDADLLRLRPGDGVEFRVDTRSLSSGSPLVSTLTDTHRKPFEEQVRDLTQVLGDENLSRVIVATARGRIVELQSFFRVQTVKYGWSTAGLKVSFDFQNYYVPRNQVGDSANPDPGRAQRKTTPKGSL